MAVDAPREVPDASAARRERVRAAVGALVDAIGAEASGATYLEAVQAWARGVNYSAKKLPALSQQVRNAGHRLPASPAGLRAAREAFAREIDDVRRLFGDARPAARQFYASRHDDLGPEVRPTLARRRAARVAGVRRRLVRSSRAVASRSVCTVPGRPLRRPSRGTRPARRTSCRRCGRG